MKCLIIMGLPRGGTSAAAAIAEGLGIQMFCPGDYTEPAAEVRHRYPFGNFEDATFRKLAWEFTGVGSDPGACYRQFNRKWRDELFYDERQRLTAWINKRHDHAADAGKNVFGVKLPGATSIIKPLVQCLEKQGIVPVPYFIHRCLNDAAQSLCTKRGHQADPDAPMAWATAVQQYNAYHLSKAQSACARLGVTGYHLNFEDVTLPTTQAVTSIARRCDLPFRADAGKKVVSELHKQSPAAPIGEPVGEAACAVG